ncbi:MAG: sugar phosphate isomerase/epimerase [bacterium]|nr:MAG: sugar phosphate isomerase/epimerase [bacterium]
MKKSSIKPLRLALVTYKLGMDWDVDTLIKNCTEAQFEAVELRTTHAHKVEVDLSTAQRKEVRKRFEDSPVKLVSLGSAFEYDSPDPTILERNIEGTKEYIKLAHDVGATGVKVRPNRLHLDKGIPEETTLRQIGKSLYTVGEFGKDYDVEIRVEVHGKETQRIPRMKKMIDYADHENVFICWNCNKADLEDDGFEVNFNSVRDKIRFVHIHDLFDETYPYRKLFSLLKEIKYDSYCGWEVGYTSSDAVRLMKYYRALFLALQNAY